MGRAACKGSGVRLYYSLRVHSSRDGVTEKGLRLCVNMGYTTLHDCSDWTQVASGEEGIVSLRSHFFLGRR